MPSQIEMPMNTVSAMSHTAAVHSLITPVSQANQHAASAEEYAGAGLIVLAAEEHHKASEALLAAIERSHDESVRTRSPFSMFHTHSRAGKANTAVTVQQALQGARRPLPQDRKAEKRGEGSQPPAEGRPSLRLLLLATVPIKLQCPAPAEPSSHVRVADA
jgi:hypothetical protein